MTLTEEADSQQERAAWSRFSLAEAMRGMEDEEGHYSLEDLEDAWQAPAEIEADPELAAAIEKGLEDLAEGRTIDWNTLRKELDL